MANFIGNINILDIVVIALTILLLLFGIWRGMYKMINGLISSIIALVLAIILTSTVVTFVIDNTLLDDKLVDVLAIQLDKYVPNSQQVVAFYDIDNDAETPDELGFNPGTGVKPFEEIFEGSKIAFLSAPIKSLVEKQVTEYGEAPFLKAMVAVITAYILTGVAFILLMILLFIIIRLLFALIKKVVSATYIGYYVNKVVGGILGLAVAGALVFGFLTIVKLLSNYSMIITINTMIDDSTVTKLLAQNNFLYGLIGDIDIQSQIDKIMAMIDKIKS